MNRQALTDPHLHPEPAPGATTVVFDDHRFCAGTRTLVEVMAAPHMHSQFELNYVQEGSMTYWFDDHIIEIPAGALVLFWGMIPHRTIARAPGTHFSCLYIPSALLIGVPTCEDLRAALFDGAFVAARPARLPDGAMAERWRQDLLTGDPLLESIVRDEVSARLRRIERDGWQDLRDLADTRPMAQAPSTRRLPKVEAMARFIDEHASRDIDVSSIARAAGLQPAYAMELFKRGVGQTIMQYVIRRRLDVALSLLVSTDDPVAEIGFRAGFGSLSRFYEAFTSRFGMSPKRYRRHYRHLFASGETARLPSS